MDCDQTRTPTRHTRLRGVLGAGLAAAAIAGCGSSSTTSTTTTPTASPASTARPAAAPAPISARVLVRRSPLGSILVDMRGRTLYLFSADRGGHSACASACAHFWPPQTTGAAPTAGAGLRAPLLGAVTGPAGVRLVTYAGHPLYRFALDARPGQTRGEERRAFGGRFDVVSPAGDPIRPRPAAQPTTSTAVATATRSVTTQTASPPATSTAVVTPSQPAVTHDTSTTHSSTATHSATTTHTSTAPPPAGPGGIPQNNGGDQDADNNGGPSDGDGNV